MDTINISSRISSVLGRTGLFEIPLSMSRVRNGGVRRGTSFTALTRIGHSFKSNTKFSKAPDVRRDEKNKTDSLTKGRYKRFVAVEANLKLLAMLFLRSLIGRHLPAVLSAVLRCVQSCFIPSHNHQLRWLVSCSNTSLKSLPLLTYTHTSLC